MPDAPKRVAFFTNTFVPDVNGVAHVTKVFREELQRRGTEVYVFAPSPSPQGYVEDDALVFRFPAVRLASVDYSVAMPFSPRIFHTLKKVRFDLVHTHHPLWVGQWGARYARRTRTPLITTIHTHYELFASVVPVLEPLIKMYLRVNLRRYCNRCDVVTTPAASNQQRLQSAGVIRPVLVVPNPVRVAVFEKGNGKQIRARYGLNGKFVLGYLGRLSSEKQVEVVVEAAGLVCKQRNDVHLVIVGDGPAMSSIQARIRHLALEKYCTLVGSIPHDQAPDYHAAFDVFLTASIAETQPMAYAEAMAAGKPVIAVEGLGAVDMIEHEVNGFLVSRERAAEAMSEAVLSLAADREMYRRMCSQAQAWARRYDVREATDRLVEAYSLALEQAQGHCEVGTARGWI
jgi:glycosyltransferase involved in cell wall biosynthesis